tara:strand:- start:1095 stop:2006 length:912 start_codon:yes stop_codon:yes gene_type:complete
MIKLLLKTFIIFFIFLNSNGYSLISEPKGYPKCVNSDVNKSDFCPLEAKLGHTLILVDFTSRWQKPQIDWVKGRIFGEALISGIPPYNRISYLKIDNTPPHSQKYVYSKCRFKTGTKTKFEGDKVNSKCEGSDFISNIYKAWRSQIDEVEKNFFPKNEEADQSLIYEYIIHVLRELSADFGSDYQKRELIIVSDLMQYSERVNFFKHCKSASEKLKPKNKQKADKCGTFEKLMKNEKSFANYIERTKPNQEMLKNLKVKVLFINHSYQTRQDLYITLEQLWIDMFKYIGINDYEIIPQIDFGP